MLVKKSFPFSQYLNKNHRHRIKVQQNSVFFVILLNWDFCYKHLFFTSRSPKLNNTGKLGKLRKFNEQHWKYIENGIYNGEQKWNNLIIN